MTTNRSTVRRLKINDDNKDELEHLDEYTSLTCIDFDQVTLDDDSPNTLLRLFGHNQDHVIIETYEDPDIGGTQTIHIYRDTTDESYFHNIDKSRIHTSIQQIDDYVVVTWSRAVHHSYFGETATDIYYRYEFTREMEINPLK